ncbi:MAG: PAS domain S-box protein [Myxococcota bacterium]|nr:PAS domain S-box protein [Myxococcota bacterium]
MSVFLLDGTYEYINRAGAAVIAMDAAAVEGRRYLEFFPELAEQPFDVGFARVASGVSSLEHLELHHGATDRWSSQRLQRVNDRVIVWGEDITARKAAERAREVERTRLLHLLAQAPFAVVVYEGADHRAALSNPKHDEMVSGRVRIGMPLVESMPELAGQPVIAVLDEVFSTGATRVAEQMRVELLRDGAMQPRWFDLTWQPLRGPTGAVTEVLVCAVDVTVHVQAQQRREAARAEAEASQRLTAAVTANTTLGLVMMDASQHCTFMNPAAERIVGSTFAEIAALDRPLHDIIHHRRPDGSHYPMAECPIDRALPARLQEYGEDVFVRRDGTFYPVSFTASPILDRGVAIGTIIELADITERRQAEHLARVTEQKFTTIFERAPFPICLVAAASTRIVDVNPAWVELIGYAKHEAVGRTSVELGMSRDHEAREQIRGELQRTGSSRGSEVRATTRAGRTLGLLTNIETIEVDGEPHWLVTSQDTTEQRHAEDALRASERQFRELVNNLPELAWSARADGHIDFYSRRWYEYTGTTPAEMEGWGWKRVHDPAMLERVIEKWTHSLESGQPFEMEFPLRAADGSFRWFLTRVRPLRDAAGAVVRWFGINTDVTELRQAEQRALDAVAAAQAAVRMRDEFLSIASHELRTPLTPLQLQLQGIGRLLAMRVPDVAEKLAGKLVIATRQTERLTRLIDGLLDVARITEGKIDLDREHVDLAGVATEVAERHQAQALAAGCRITVHAEQRAAGTWDRLRIDQILTNLVTNAIKYGAGKPIDIGIKRVDGFAHVVVRDHGIGIAEHDRQRIFERFERAVSSTNYGGLGLGLYIARQLAEAHHGKITVESAPGDGVVFTLTLPADQERVS